MASNAPLDGVLSHWCTLIENLQASPLEFYKAVEAAIRRREVPETTNARVDYRESGALSAKREYLHVTRDKLIFDICGAPFGTGFFVSWWLVEEERNLNPLLKVGIVIVLLSSIGGTLAEWGLLWGTLAVLIVVFGVLAVAHKLATGGTMSDDFVRVLPILGPLYNWLFKSVTYYRIDTTLMFQKAIHNAVLEVIDEMTTAKGLRALGEHDRKPVMREFYQRKAA